MMKKLTLLALVLAAPTATFASDVAAGAWEITGGTNLKYSSTTLKIEGTKVSEDSQYGLETGVAYYLTPMVGLGAELSYDHTTSKDSFSGVETKESMYFIGPKLVLDFGVAPQVSLFVDAAVGYVGGDMDGTSASGWGYGVGAGVKYFFNRAVSGDLSLKYAAQSVTAKPSTGNVTADQGILQFGIGISVYLNNAPASH